MLTRKERGGYAKDTISAGDKRARFESWRPISTEHSGTLGIRGFGAPSLRHTNVDKAFLSWRDGNYALHDLCSQKSAAWTMELD